MSLGLGSRMYFDNPLVQAIYENMVKENEVSNDHRRQSNSNVQERGERDEARKSSPVQEMPVRSMDDGKVHGQAEPTAISRTVQMPDNWFMDLQHPARQSGENTPDHRMSDANSGKRVKHSRGRSR